MSLNYKSGKCLEPDCDKPAENGLFCKKHSESTADDRHQESQALTVSNLASGQSGYVCPALCFYMIEGQIYIGGNFPVNPDPNVVCSLKVTMQSNGLIAITPDGLKQINLWISPFALEDFIKVTVTDEEPQ